MARKRTSKIPSEGPYGIGAKSTVKTLEPPPILDPKRAERERNYIDRMRAPEFRHRESRMVETHLGGKLEDVPGFPHAIAMTHGYQSRLLSPTDVRRGRIIPSDVGRQRPLPEPILAPERRFSEGEPWTRISDTSRVPWRSICHLEITYEDNREAFGSAWFSGPDTLITAGHNLYIPDSRVWARHIRVVPGRDENFGPFGETFAIRTDVLPGWVSGGEPEYDLGTVKVADSSLGYAAGWFGYAVFTDDDLSNGPLIQSAGYPFETRPFATQWYDAGRAQYHSDNFITYRVDTEPGQSGAPVFFSNSQGQRWVVATHVYNALSSNLGLRVTDDVFDVIEAWSQS